MGIMLEKGHANALSFSVDRYSRTKGTFNQPAKYAVDNKATDNALRSEMIQCLQKILSSFNQLKIIYRNQS